MHTGPHSHLTSAAFFLWGLLPVSIQNTFRPLPLKRANTLQSPGVLGGASHPFPARLLASGNTSCPHVLCSAPQRTSILPLPSLPRKPVLASAVVLPSVVGPGQAQLPEVSEAWPPAHGFALPSTLRYGISRSPRCLLAVPRLVPQRLVLLFRPPCPPWGITLLPGCPHCLCADDADLASAPQSPRPAAFQTCPPQGPAGSPTRPWETELTYCLSTSTRSCLISVAGATVHPLAQTRSRDLAFLSSSPSPPASSWSPRPSDCS